MTSAAQVKSEKQTLVKKFGKTEQNTGTTEVQVALITKRINELTGHLIKHKKDHSSRRGLLKLVGQRKSLLSYLRDRDQKRYVNLINALALRK